MTNLYISALKRNRIILPALCYLLVAAAFALRTFRLDYFSLRGDESFTVLFVLKPFAQMWKEILTVEPNPPLLYLMLRVWVAVAGAGEFAARYFSVFWGVLCVPLIYRFARSFAINPAPQGRPLSHLERLRQTDLMALVAALLVAINPYQIWHSQDVRNYTMWPALSLLALIFFWHWTHRAADSRGAYRLLTLGGFIIAELATLYTHYYEAFILLAINLYALFFLVRRRAWSGWKFASLLQWALAQLILALLYLPFPLIISNRVASYGEGSGQQGIALWDIWQRTFNVFALGDTIDAIFAQGAWIVLAVALALIFLVRWRVERRGVFFLLYAGVPTLAVFLLSRQRPLFLERYLNGIAPAYYLLFGWGISALALSRFPAIFGRGLAILGITAFALLSHSALSNYWYNPAYSKSPDWRLLARAIDEQSRDGDVILQNFPETSLVYYARRSLPLVVYPTSYLPDAQTAHALDGLNGRFSRVWFIPAAEDYWDPEQYVETWLDRHDDLQFETRVATFRLGLFNTPRLFLAAMQPAGVTIGRFAELIGYRLEKQESVWRLVIYWRAQATTKKEFNVMVRLSTNDESQILAHVEHPPVNGSFPTNKWQKNEVIVDQYDVPIRPTAGSLVVGMYDPTASAFLPILDAAGNPQGDSFKIPIPTSP